MRLPARKFLSIGLLLLISALGVNIAAQTETAAVRGIAFKSSEGSLEVRVTAASGARFGHFELGDPHRLVLDFHGLQNNVGFKERQIGVAGVERVRTGSFTDKNGKAARIVFDLTGDVPYRVLEDGGGIVRIEFGTKVAPLNLSAGPPIVPAELPSATLLQIKETAAITAPAVPILPVLVRPTVAPQQTQVTIVPSTPPVTGTTPTPIPQYSGELISLDLRDYDVKDFFRLISEISGLNVVLDPNVGGSVTLKLTDVPWDQALDVVLKNYQLGGQLQGNVLRIATHTALQAEQQAQKALKDAQDLAAALETRTFVLNYTKADTLSTTLQKLLSPRGTIIMDSRRNALIVSDIPSQFGKVDDMVKFLDTPAQQVEIEARLLSATKSFSRELGTQLGLLIGKQNSNVLTGVFPTTRNVPLAVGLPAPGASSGLAFLGKAGADVILDEIITAAEARGTAKLISRPRVTTQNNQAATVSQGTQIPVPTITNATTQSTAVQFLNFALRLEVTPQITEAGTIVLTAIVENSTPDFARAINGIPSVATQRAQTQVLIPDGGTAVIGGILVDSDAVNIRQVPGLGSLPVIGSLFKNTNTVKSTTELIFFITPRIKPPDSVAVAVPGEAQPAARPR